MKKSLQLTSKRLSSEDVGIVSSELAAIERRDGLIRPTVVVAEARDEASPLHKFFEWSDSVAAERYREVQARQLIQSVLVRDVSKGGDSPLLRAFVNVKIEADEDEESTAIQGYCAMSTVLKSTGLRQQTLAYAKQQLTLWRQKFGHLSEFLGVSKEIDKL